MADNYVEFSEVIPQLTDEEQAWLAGQLQTVALIDGQEYAVDQQPVNLAEATWRGPRFLSQATHFDDCDDGPGFQFRFCPNEAGSPWGRHLWLFSDEYGDLDQVAELVQQFLRRFRPSQSWAMCYAATCSKPRVGEFGGGAVIITAKRIVWHDAQAIAEREQSGVASNQHKTAGFSARELATVLAALRYWQAALNAPSSQIAATYPHFDGGLPPLSAAEIDELCDDTLSSLGLRCKR